MKKRIGFLTCMVLVMLCAAAIADVAIDETHFPDEHFRKAILTYDRNGDRVLSKTEIEAATILRIARNGIADLTGIEYFTSVTELDCGQNQLKKIDLSKNKELKRLWCNANQITSLDLKGNADLVMLDCSNNSLSKLDLSKNTALVYLYCYRNKLTSLDLSHNTKLSDVYLSYNKLKTLDISQCPVLCDLLRRVRPGYSEKFGGYGWWDYLQDGSGSGLFVDETVKVITDGKTKVRITSITLNVTETALKKGKTLQLKPVKILPADAADKKVKWTSSDKKVATVSSKGKVKAKKKGTCIITCTAADGSGVKATCRITVK